MSTTGRLRTGRLRTGRLATGRLAAGRLAAGILGLSLLPVTVQAAPRLGESVALTACVRPAVEANCLIISGPDGTVFNITSANPKPPRDVMIELRGTVTDK